MSLTVTRVPSGESRGWTYGWACMPSDVSRPCRSTQTGVRIDGDAMIVGRYTSVPSAATSYSYERRRPLDSDDRGDDRYGLPGHRQPFEVERHSAKRVLRPKHEVA